MGLGGGAVGVLVMTAAGRSVHQAIGTSAGFGLAVAIPGAIGFIIAGLSVEGLPAYSLGFVNGPAFLMMSAAAFFAAPLGAKTALRVKGELLSKIFAVYVLIAALSMVFDAVV